MRWGDVLCAAMDACAAGGIDREVEADDLPRLIQQILAVRGNMGATYSSVNPRRNETQRRVANGRKP